MNLERTPTKDQLAELLGSVDDTSDSHVLWVADDGEVFVEPLKEHNPVGLEEARSIMRMRHETFSRGSGHVGRHAAGDAIWLSDLFGTLVDEWRKARSSHGIHYIG